jgi:hypothetical protein
MFDVYLSDKRDLLVVRSGYPIPNGGASGRWRKQKKRVTLVSEEIRRAVQRQGYYIRKVGDFSGNARPLV